MPQFDTFSFLSQLFWLFSFFFLMLLSLNYYLLPALSTILKVRNSLLSFDLCSSWKVSYSLSFLSCFFKIRLVSIFTLAGVEKNNQTVDVIINQFVLENIFGNIFLTGLFQKILNTVLLGD